MDSIEPMSNRLATGSGVFLDLLYTVPIVFSDIARHATTELVPCWIVKKL